MKKILVIRFSSIGDIVLTSPVLRCLKRQLPGTETHFVTRESFSDLLIHNPYLSKLHTFKKDISEIYTRLKSEKFDLVIDLHKNLRSFRLKQKLGVKSYSFDKINVNKFIAVNFKSVKSLPPVHVVDRYFETVKPLGVNSDGAGLDYFIGDSDKVDTASRFFNGSATPFGIMVIGGSYYTKQIPEAKLLEIAGYSVLPLLMLGGSQDVALAEKLKLHKPELINACGILSIGQSASVISQAQWVITSDTGLMHIASAFNIKIISVWGNTIPEFGMSPYKPNPENKITEIKNLPCRPCSKLGYSRCPKKHFNCMNQIDFSFVSDLK